MAWSRYTVFALIVAPFLLWIVLGQVFWEMYQFEMSLKAFSDMFNMLYFGFTTLYFMGLFVKVWSESLGGGLARWLKHKKQAEAQ